MFRVVLAIGLLALFFSGCTKDHVQSSDCQTCPDTVYFHANILPIFAQNCALSGCHLVATGSNAGVGLDSTTAYASITKTGTGYVNAGNPNTSVLLSQLYQGASLHMPPSAQLDPCSIEEISCWIQQGARNN